MDRVKKPKKDLRTGEETTWDEYRDDPNMEKAGVIVHFKDATRYKATLYKSKEDGQFYWEEVFGMVVTSSYGFPDPWAASNDYKKHVKDHFGIQVKGDKS